MCLTRTGSAWNWGGWKKAKHRQMLELGSSQYSNCITSIQKDYMIQLDYGTVKF